MPYISGSPSSASGYRTNLFLLSANGTANTVVDVTLRKADGTSAGTKTITLGKFSQTQINGIANFFGYTPAASETNMTALVTVTSGGPVATGASVIDNAIGSISYSPPVKIPVANNGAYGLILNDGYGFSGRAEIFDGLVRLPLGRRRDSRPARGSPTLFFLQGFGRRGPTEHDVHEERGRQHVVRGNDDGQRARRSRRSRGRILTKFDGTIYGTLTYTRAAGAREAIRVPARP